MIEFKKDDIVIVTDDPDDEFDGCLWKIAKLGAQTLYSNGWPCSEDSTRLSLYRVPPGQLWINYPKTITVWRSQITLAPGVLVLAYEATEMAESTAKRWLQARREKRARNGQEAVRKRSPIERCLDNATWST